MASDSLPINSLVKAVLQLLADGADECGPTKGTYRQLIADIRSQYGLPEEGSNNNE